MDSTRLNLLAADATLILHSLYVLFVVLGLVLIYLGLARGWSWVRNPWFRLAHLLAIGVVVVQTWLRIDCPLTVWENQLRETAGTSGYDAGFIAHWLQKFLFYEASPRVFLLSYTVFGLLVVIGWIVVRPRGFRARGPNRDEMTPGGHS